MSGATRSLTDLFSMFGGRRAPAARAVAEPGASASPTHPTKALAKFLKLLKARENPVLIDLGPVVGPNVTFFGEQLGCRIRVEDVAGDIEQHVKDGRTGQLAAFFASRFAQPSESVDGILCWDVLDFLDRPAAHALAIELTRILRPDGALLAFFNTVESKAQVYTKFVVTDDTTLRYKTYPSSRARQRVLLNRDIIKMFEGLRVAESFLMKNNVREILFRKPS